MIEIKDLPPREFIRKYAMLIYEIDVLKFALLLSCGDSLDQAARLAMMSEERLLEALSTLERIGYLRMGKPE